jgi:microcystin degradation protein MlrC
MGRRVLLAGLYHETHTFLNGVTALSDFAALRGEEMLRAAGDASPLGGVLEFARQAGWEVMPVLDLRAAPGPTAADEVVETFREAFRAAGRSAGKIEGVYLVLHGAMVSESLPDVEGSLLCDIRLLEGLAEAPLCGVLDLHANFTASMAEHSSGLLSYRRNPHTDAREAAMDAARLLDRLMRSGERPATVYAHPPIVWPPTGTGTDDEPMRSLESRAREIERAHPEIPAVNVFGGYAFADTPDTGVSFSAVTLGDPAEARREMESLSALALDMKEKGCRSGMPLEAAIGQIMKEETDRPLSSSSIPHPSSLLLVEPADNIGGGAPGDLTIVLRALVERGIRNAGVVINDPESVRELWDRPIGSRARAVIGGKSGVIGAEPLPLEVEILSRSDGQFMLEDARSHLAAMVGAQADMGPCVVVRHEGVRILLTSRKTPPFDLGQWRSQDIYPEDLSVIGVKAAVAHRRAYDPITRSSYVLDTPGPCAENLRRLPYLRIRRPIYPLDDIPCADS